MIYHRWKQNVPRRADLEMPDLEPLSKLTVNVGFLSPRLQASCRTCEIVVVIVKNDEWDSFYY